MPADIWICDWKPCGTAQDGGLAEELWAQIRRPGLRYTNDAGRVIIGDRLVFHSDACMALWVRKHLLESAAQR